MGKHLQGTGGWADDDRRPGWHAVLRGRSGDECADGPYRHRQASGRYQDRKHRGQTSESDASDPDHISDKVFVVRADAGTTPAEMFTISANGDVTVIGDGNIHIAGGGSFRKDSTTL